MNMGTLAVVRETGPSGCCSYVLGSLRSLWHLGSLFLPGLEPVDAQLTASCPGFFRHLHLLLT
jgi:hypothetical protein